MEGIKACPVVPVAELPSVFEGFPYRTARLEKPDRFLTVYHYENQGDVFALLNENPSETFEQWVTLPASVRLTVYDAWRNRLSPAKMERAGDAWKVYVRLAPLEMLVLADAGELTPKAEADAKPAADAKRECMELTAFRVSRCQAKEYPAFYGEEDADLINGMEGLHPEFSGYYRYETTVRAENWQAACLTIGDAYESAEVFVNGASVGMVTAQPYFFELGDLDGDVSLAIEVATTLERKGASIGADVQGMGTGAPLSPTGIVGEVILSYRREA